MIENNRLFLHETNSEPYLGVVSVPNLFAYYLRSPTQERCDQAKEGNEMRQQIMKLKTHNTEANGTKFAFADLLPKHGSFFLEMN